MNIFVTCFFSICAYIINIFPRIHSAWTGRGKCRVVMGSVAKIEMMLWKVDEIQRILEFRGR